MSDTYEKALDAAGLTALSDAADAFLGEAKAERGEALSPKLRAQCRWLYLTIKIQTRQQMGRDVPEKLWKQHDYWHEQCDELMDASPSSLL